MKRQIRHSARWPPGEQDWAPERRSSCSVPETRPKTWDPCAVAHEGKAQFERVCGISRGPGCCTLLLYSLPSRSNYVSDLWS